MACLPEDEPFERFARMQQKAIEEAQEAKRREREEKERMRHPVEMKDVTPKKEILLIEAVQE